MPHGLDHIVHAVREGRIGFQRLLTYTFNMLVKKFEIVLFLAAGLVDEARNEARRLVCLHQLRVRDRIMKLS